jgi:FkbM family methyltransferase
VATVVDLGCYEHGHGALCDSIGELTRAYQPECLYGFDPHPDFEEASFAENGTELVLERKAAWVFNGETEYTANGTGSRLGGGERVRCFDFSRWFAAHGPAVVKMDVEGAEYTILDRMLKDGTDKLIEELVVEWHGDPHSREPFLERLTCPIKEWWL